jgi:hypothetical protein
MICNAGMKRPRNDQTAGFSPVGFNHPAGQPSRECNRNEDGKTMQIHLQLRSQAKQARRKKYAEDSFHNYMEFTKEYSRPGATHRGDDSVNTGFSRQNKPSNESLNDFQRLFPNCQ